MVQVTTPIILRRLREILGLRQQSIVHSQNSIFPVAPVENFPAGVKNVNRAFNKTVQYNFSSGVTPTSDQIITVTAGKIGYIHSFLLQHNSGAAAIIVLRDATADAGTTVIHVRPAAQIIIEHVSPVPIPIKNGLRFDAGDQTASTDYFMQFSYAEEDLPVVE